MSISVSQAFKRTSANPVDETLALTKAEMLAVNDNLMPEKYLTVCQDDGFIYLYDKSATPNSTTGKFTKFEGGSGGASALNDLTDVTISSAAQDQILKYNGSGWVNSSVPEDTTKYGTSDSASTDIADADYIPFYDSSASAKKKTLWSNIKTVLANTFQPKLTAGTNITISNNTISASAGAVGVWARSDIYSTTEKVVGCWHDGRPIYQKTVNFGSGANATTKSVAHGISSLKEVVDFKVVGNEPGAFWMLNYQDPSIEIHSWVDATNINVQSTLNDSGSSYYVTLWYTKTTDAANSYNYSDENDYSTSEKLIGKWTDGSNLYQRTFTGTFPSSVSTGGDEITISSFSYWSGLKEIKATIKWKEGTTYGITNIPYTDNNSAMIIVQSHNRGLLEFWAVNKNSGLNAFYSQPYVVTIKYTK